MSITIAIKLPAKVRDFDQALDRIGGIDKIAKVSTAD